MAEERIDIMDSLEMQLKSAKSINNKYFVNQLEDEIGYELVGHLHRDDQIMVGLAASRVQADFYKKANRLSFLGKITNFIGFKKLSEKYQKAAERYNELYDAADLVSRAVFTNN